MTLVLAGERLVDGILVRQPPREEEEEDAAYKG